jgi:hypothetical protein
MFFPGLLARRLELGKEAPGAHDVVNYAGEGRFERPSPRGKEVHSAGQTRPSESTEDKLGVRPAMLTPLTSLSTCVVA